MGSLEKLLRKKIVEGSVMANLYLISQSKNRDYDSYDSAVVVANSKASAAKIHPGGYDWPFEFDVWRSGSWVDSPKLVTAELIGTARKGLLPGEVIVASYNAG